MEIEQRRGLSESPKKESASAQLAAAHIAFLLDLLKVSDATAKDFATSQGLEKGLNKKAVKRVHTDTRTALVDLYFIKEQGLDPQVFEKRLGEQAVVVTDLFNTIVSQMQERKDEYLRTASDLSRLDRVRIAIKARKKLKELSEDQRTNLLSVAGYAEQRESTRITKKIATSGILTGVAAIPYTVGTIGAIALEKAHPFVQLAGIYDGKTQVAIALSYLISYSAAYVTSQTNVRLLKDPKINTCPNIFATGLYFMLKKLVPESELMADLGVRVGTFAPGIIQEPAVIASLFVPILGPQAVLARNIAGGVLNLGQAGINEVWLKRKGNHKE